MTAAGAIRIGTAGWAIPRRVAEAFPPEGSTLQRYAAVFDVCEINTTFYRPHRPSTYLRWAQSVPPDFRFALKLPRSLTHVAKLATPEAELEAFMTEAGLLGERLGLLLVQLPPSLAFDPPIAGAFFAALRARWAGPAACEPRHATWFEPAADALLANNRVARVAADPARHPTAGAPGGWRDLAYFRLHGSPQIYRSPYGTAALHQMAEALTEGPAESAWCVFDNTASGAAAADALDLQRMLQTGPGGRIQG